VDCHGVYELNNAIQAKPTVICCQSFIFGGLAIVDVAGEEICIDFDVATGGPELIVLVGGRGKANKVEESVAAHFEEELLELINKHNVMQRIGDYLISYTSQYYISHYV